MASMDEREKRLAKNETLFRSVNERIEKIAAPGGDDGHHFEFFCECSNAACNLLLPLTLAQYESVRKNARHFVVAPGHDLPEIEMVVARERTYQVVTKVGEAAEYVTERDPRAESPPRG
jgi:hypothetical protein